MNDIEKHLKTIPPAAPEPPFDRRMDRLFLEAPRRTPLWRRPVPLWAAGVAAGAMLVAGVLLAGSIPKSPNDGNTHAETVRSVYFIQAPPDFQRAIERGKGSVAQPRDGAEFVIKVSPFETPISANGDSSA